MKRYRTPKAARLKAISGIKQAARRGANIICLQELFTFPYFPQSRSEKWFRYAESIPGPMSKLFSQLARELKVILIVPLFERAGKIFFNSLVIMNERGKTILKYRKTHLPNDPCFYERYYFSKGNLGLPVVKTKYGIIGALICWDQWFPEAARALAQKGAQIIFYPTAIALHERQMKSEWMKEKEAWQLIQRAHGIANGVYIASVNRVGREGKLTFWGNSFVSGPFGEFIKEASAQKEEILIARCDLAEIKRVRSGWPFLKEARYDLY